MIKCLSKYFFIILTFIIVNFFNISYSENIDKFYEKIDLFSEVLEKIRDEYVDDIDQTEVMDSAINGVLKSLDPYSAYNVLFNNQVVDNSIFTTNKYGGNTVIEFQVPLIKDGDYKVQLTKASESTAITTYKGDNTESSLTYTIVSDIVFKPSSTFIADQMVFFSWDSDIDAGSAFKTITIKLDDTTILNGQINSTEFK